jgi:hypothetical protein
MTADAMDEALRESVVTRTYLDMRLSQLTIRIGGMVIAAVAILIGVKFFG